jgi:hypothetical protein
LELGLELLPLALELEWLPELGLPLLELVLPLLELPLLELVSGQQEQTVWQNQGVCLLESTRDHLGFLLRPLCIGGKKILSLGVCLHFLPQCLCRTGVFYAARGLLVFL